MSLRKLFWKMELPLWNLSPPDSHSEAKRLKCKQWEVMPSNYSWIFLLCRIQWLDSDLSTKGVVGNWFPKVWLAFGDTSPVVVLPVLSREQVPPRAMLVEGREANSTASSAQCLGLQSMLSSLSLQNGVFAILGKARGGGILDLAPGWSISQVYHCSSLSWQVELPGKSLWNSFASSYTAYQGSAFLYAWTELTVHDKWAWNE